MIEEAGSELEIQFFLNYGNYTKPTGAVRRSWIRAAKARRELLKEEVAKGIRLLA